MSRATRRRMGGVGLLLLVGAGAAAAALLETSPPDPAYPLRRHVRYAISVRNETNRLVPRGELWVYAPVRQTAAQRCLRLRTSPACELSADEKGNQVLRFTLEDVAPYSTRTVTIDADLALAKEPNPLPRSDLAAFLLPEKYVESAHPEIVRAAAALAGPSPLEVARRTLEWVARNVRYAGYLREDRGALHALRTGRGDCTEYATLFVALCRANGIPARGVTGYVVAEDAVLRPDAFHHWAEVYADGLWRLADPQRSVFRANAEQYVATRIRGPTTRDGIGEAARFRVVGAGLSARMN